MKIAQMLNTAYIITSVFGTFVINNPGFLLNGVELLSNQFVYSSLLIVFPDMVFILTYISARIANFIFINSILTTSKIPSKISTTMSPT